MPDVPPELAAAISDLLDGVPRRDLARAVDALMTGYRGTDAPAPVDDPVRVAAYAAYRMPATYAAVHAALTATAAVLPDLRPRAVVDVGGGTGAAAWAAVDVFGSVESVVVLERSAAMADAGRRLAARAPAEALRRAEWRPTDLSHGPELPPADLVTAAYVVGELADPARTDLANALAATGAVVAVIEPGTPAGSDRVYALRAALIGAGLSVVAPCPHDDACPMPPGRDWCHYATRVHRTAVHRALKGGTLPYEDEKFAYVSAVRGPVVQRPGGRIVRHPLTRKGMVSLRLCTRDARLATEVVSKRHGTLYRAARDARWGDAWPPGDAEE